MDGLFNMLGGNATGVQNLLTPEMQQAIRNQSMMAMAASLLKASGPSPQRQTLGQVLGGAFEAGQGAMQQGQMNAVQQMLLGQKLQEAQDTRQRNAQIRTLLGGGTAADVVQPINLPVEQAGRVGPTVQRGGMAAQAPTNPLLANLTDTQRAILQVSPPEKAFELLGQFERDRVAQAEVTGQPFEVTDAQGRPVMVQQTKGGKITTLEGFGPKRDVVLQTFGGRTVAIDRNKLQGGETFQHTMTPGEASNLSLRLQETEMVETPEGFVRVPKFGGGAARPVLGPTGQPVRGKPSAGAENATEGERKAATLLSRVMIAEQQIGESAAVNPRAAAPGILNPVTPRMLQPEERKQIEDAQDEFLDAALTLSTGAAYTREQFEAARRTYFPTVDDDAQTIQNKADRRRNVIESARVAAGRAAGQVPAMPAPRTDMPAPRTGAATAAPRTGQLVYDSQRRVWVYQQ